MKYTSEEALSEIMVRSSRIALHRAKRSCRILSGATGALAVALILVIGVLPGKLGLSKANTVYGAFLLSPESGGYVLTALIAFVLGVTVTLMCRRYRKRKNDSDDDRRGE